VLFLFVVQVATRSKAWGLPALTCWVRIPPEAWMCAYCDCFTCYQVEVSAADWSLVQRSPTEHNVTEYDLRTSIMRKPRPTRGCRAMKQILFDIFLGTQSLSFVTTFPTSDLLCRTRSTMISKSTFILNPQIHRACVGVISVILVLNLQPSSRAQCIYYIVTYSPVAYKLFFRRTDFITCAQPHSFILPAEWHGGNFRHLRTICIYLGSVIISY